MHQPPGPPESFIFFAFSYPILRPNLSSFSANPRGASAPRTPRILHFPLEFLPFSSPILRLNLSSFSAIPRGGSAPRTTRILHFPLEFLPFSSPILRLNLSSFFASSRGAWAFPTIFLPHTEAQLKLIFCESARCHRPQDHQNPSFSLHFPTPY